jgi:outer membrane protein assembly factor BamB
MVGNISPLMCFVCAEAHACGYKYVYYQKCKGFAMRVSALGVFVAVVTALVLLLSLAGCDGQDARVQGAGTDNPAAAAGPAALPLPQTLASKRQAAAAVLYLDGGAFDTAFFQRVSAGGDAAGFAPIDDGSTPLPQAMAYALYRFDVSGTTGAQTLSLVWSGAPPDVAQGWIGLGNWGQDRWDWLQPSAAGELELSAAQFAAYTKAGTSELLCLVGVTGSQSCTLQGLGFELPPPTPQWPMFGHDPQHTFRSEAVGSQTGQLKWTFRTSGYGNPIFEPATAPDGTIYACDSIYLCAYDPDGNVLWRFLPASGPCRSPVVCPNGTIVFIAGPGQSVGIPERTLYAVNPDGTLKWENPDFAVTSVNNMKNDLVAGADSTIYFCPYQQLGSTDGIIAINPDGSKRWGAPYGSEGCPAIAADGTVFVGDAAGLHALDADGTLLWTIPEPAYCDVVVGPDGVVYCYGNFGHVYSVSAMGVLNWDYVYPKSDCWPARPAFGPGGMIYLAFYRNAGPGTTAALCALTSAGELCWSYEAISGFSAVAVAENGSVIALSYSLHSSDQASLICFDSLGHLNWAYDGVGYVNWANGLVALPDGGVLVGTWDYGVLHAVNANGSQRWVCGAGGSVRWNPVIGQDGVVYLGCSDGTLYSVNPDGTLQWKYEHPASSFQCPVVTNDTVYDTATNVPLYALSLSGTLKWSMNPPNTFSVTSPIRGPDGMVYCCSQSSLYAVGEDGAQLWDFSTVANNDALTCPAVAAGGTIYTCSSNPWDGTSTLYALNDLGEQQWAFVPDHTDSAESPAIGADGMLYVCMGLTLYAVNPDGTEKWSYCGPDYYPQLMPALAVDGTILVPCLGGAVVALNPDGTSKWEFATLGDLCGTPAMDAAGKVYFASTDRYFYCVDASGQLVWKQHLDAASYSSPAIAADGTVYVGAGNLLYAFGD